MVEVINYIFGSLQDSSDAIKSMKKNTKKSSKIQMK